MSAGTLTIRDALERRQADRDRAHVGPVAGRAGRSSRSSQIWMTWRTATVMMAGMLSGSMTLRKICQYEAPSMSDASTSSVGMPR